MADRYQAWQYDEEPNNGRDVPFAQGTSFVEVVNEVVRQYAVRADEIDLVDELRVKVEVALNPVWRTATAREVEAEHASEGEHVFAGCDERFHVSVVAIRNWGTGLWQWSIGTPVSFGGFQWPS